jgi:hypothetical protein
MAVISGRRITRAEPLAAFLSRQPLVSSRLLAFERKPQVRRSSLRFWSCLSSRCTIDQEVDHFHHNFGREYQKENPLILKKLAEALRAQSWFTVILEVLIVVVGIFVGLQVDSWNEVRKDRAKEYAYVIRLQGDLVRDAKLLGRSIDQSRQWTDGIVYAWRALDDTSLINDDPCRFVVGIQRASFNFFPVLYDHTFSEIVSNGHLGLIRSSELKDKLSRYYTAHESAEQWMDSYRDINVDFGTLFVGVLSRQQLHAVNKFENEGACEITPVDAQSARQRFLERPTLADWLPRLENRQNSLVQRLQRSLDYNNDLSVLISNELAQF